MNTSISPSSHLQLTLSASRIEKLMNSDVDKATKLSTFDKVVDFFRPQSRETALRGLHEMLHDKAMSNFARFDALSRMAMPECKALFTMTVSDHPTDAQMHKVEYAIDGKSIKTDTIDAQQKDLITLRLGEPLDTALLQKQMTTIDSYRLDTQKLVAQVKDQDFSGGGVNKKFDAKSGLLRADTKTGREDFDRELKLAKYAEGRPELASYISTQSKVTDLTLLHQDLSRDHDYAVVDIYNPEHVKSTEMDSCLNNLSRDQASSLLPQLVDMARVLYKNQVAHRDLHMHNLVVHEVRETGSVHLKAIDFGRLEMGENFEAKKFEDIDYLFDRQGASLGETIGRNYLAPKGSAVDMKHYPIHKLCEQFNERGIDMEPVLSRIGAHLKHDLQHAGEDSKLVDAAFHKASQTLQLGFAQLRSIPMHINFA